MTSRCPYAGFEFPCKGKLDTRHTSAAFHQSDEDKAAGKPDPNLMYSCEAHWQHTYDMFQEMWREYWSDRL